MYLTVSKKFEISFSHRCYSTSLSERENYALYGNESKGKYGHGHNLDVNVIFNGPVDPKTGMMINVTDIKQRVNIILEARYDHKFLNADTPPFTELTPTFERIASQLLGEIKEVYRGEPAQPVVVHLYEPGLIDVTAYDSGLVERSYFIDFSAARRTSSPLLTDEENEAIFGIAASKGGHGHHYRIRFTVDRPLDPVTGVVINQGAVDEIVSDIHSRFDHKNLNTDIPEIQDIPKTTESLARFFFHYINDKLPIKRLRLNENDYFFIELDKRKICMGVKDDFHAAHRLHAPDLSDEDNLEIFGKCNNLKGHGHQYKVEILLGGHYEARTGTIYNLMDVLKSFRGVLDEYDYKHLDLECEEFKEVPSTGENIVEQLWLKLDSKFNQRISRLTLWETANNKFTIRRQVEN